MGTPDTSRPGRVRLSATAAMLAGLAVLAPACGFGGTAEHHASRLSAGTGTAVSAAAVAPAALTGPGAGSWGNGRLDLFYRNARNGQLAHQRYVPGALATWTAAESLGGALTSQPAVTSWAAGRWGGRCTRVKAFLRSSAALDRGKVRVVRPKLPIKRFVHHAKVTPLHHHSFECC